MSKEKVLVIDDDVVLTKMLATRLKPAGFDVTVAHSAREGLKTAYQTHPDLIVLDIMMPGMDGYQACERLRELTSAPILMLTAKSREEDVIRGFEVGADDYVRKLFTFRELEARLRALLKRASRQEAQPVYNDGVLRIDLERGRVYRCGKLVHLTPTEMRLLKALAGRPGQVLSHTRLLEEVWGPAYRDAVGNLALYIRYLREKLEDDPAHPQYIRTQWGEGYVFTPAGEAA
ncbi:MAG: response regulator transcription factor [Chloroflexi bacterium]|nr:response regulator transcription factor [Chloroflexota bacterium]